MKHSKLGLRVDLVGLSGDGKYMGRGRLGAKRILILVSYTITVNFILLSLLPRKGAS